MGGVPYVANTNTYHSKDARKLSTSDTGVSSRSLGKSPVFEQYIANPLAGVAYEHSDRLILFMDMNPESLNPLWQSCDLSVAVIIPCYNEGKAIGKVVGDLRAAVPGAMIFVYDNGSSDATCAEAGAAGAIVMSEKERGKGNVVRRMFADVEADVFLMIDGDDTYDASAAPHLIKMLIENSLDMVNGARVPASFEVYRRGHRFGNAVLSNIVARVFGGKITDMLSGYRAFSRRFVKSFPVVSSGFEIETELTIHALELRLPIGEFPVFYKTRFSGSSSKLKTYSDGLRILKFIAHLIKQDRPLAFFGGGAVALALLSVLLEAPIVMTFVENGLVPRLPTAVLGIGLGLLAFLSLTCGLILETVTRGRLEAKRMHYLATDSFGLRHGSWKQSRKPHELSETLDEIVEQAAAHTYQK